MWSRIKSGPIVRFIVYCACSLYAAFCVHHIARTEYACSPVSELPWQSGLTNETRELEWDSLLLLLFRCCYSIYVNVFCGNPSILLFPSHTSWPLLLLLLLTLCAFWINSTKLSVFNVHELSLYSLCIIWAPSTQPFICL